MNFLKPNNNIAATINSTLNVPPTSNAWMIYILVIFIVVIVIYYIKDNIVNFLGKIFINTKEFVSKIINLYKKDDDIESDKEKEDKENIIGNWCFVGEDLTGRFCVKVLSAELCPKSRAFPTRDECEMVKASPMPLTVQENRGTTSIPLSGLPTV
jgi:hypothetical protein